MSVCSADPNTLPSTSADRSVGDVAGRHRRTPSASAQAGRVFDLVARLGGLVSLGALIVLACSVAGLVDGAGPADVPTVTVTFDHDGR